jgi:hypothetical protein
MKLNLPNKSTYSINEAYTIVSTCRKLGTKKLNAKKSKISRGKEAHSKTDTNFQKGITK